ncbi:MAG: hypothetical protein ABI858_01505 [Pseudoxanthomonas sp.]
MESRSFIVLRIALLVLPTLVSAMGNTVLAATPPVPLDVVLTPQVHSGNIDSLKIQLKLPEPAVASGAALLRMPVELVSTPTAAYAADQIHASDQRGTLALRAEDEAPTPSGRYRNYIATRASVGDVNVEYATPARAVDADTRNGPLFDLRMQEGGLMGAGVYFMALPPGDAPRAIHLQWDLTALPAGARGVWSPGEGEQHAVAPTDLLRFSYYAVGTMRRFPLSDDDVFHMYWMDTPPFNAEDLAEKTGRLYRYMAKFFGDDGSPYRAFARRNPYPAGGGTGLAHSFMFGYCPQGQTIAEGTQGLLAHEMAHTWPKLDGEEHALTAWYTEGTAEYYSIVLSLRSGVFDRDTFLKTINGRADGYYDNPFRSLDNKAAGELFWQEARAQRVPYGRGFMYLVDVDAQLRQHGRNARTIDDLVLEVLRRQRAAETVGVNEWRAMVVRELGADAGSQFDAMVSGKLIVPASHAFGCYRTVPYPHRPFELGFDRMRMGVVKKLQDDSNAFKAGVKEDDTIVDYTPLEPVIADENAVMQLKLLRDGKALDVSYLPRSPKVDAWRFEVDPALAKTCSP